MMHVMKNDSRGFIKIVLILIVLFITGGTIYAMRGVIPPSDESEIQAEETAGVAYAWSFTDLGADELGMPRTEVSVITDGTEHKLGTFDGSCSEQDTDLLENEKEKVVCWWAGGGKEIGVFEESGRRVVKVGDVDEGDAETGGFRGNFVAVVEL